MSIFDTDWNGDGHIDEFDTATDMFFINEMEKEQRREESELYGNDDDFDDDLSDDCNYAEINNANVHSNYLSKESQPVTMQQNTIQMNEIQQPIAKSPEDQYVILDNSSRTKALLIFFVIAVIGVAVATLTMLIYPAMFILVGSIIAAAYGMFRLNNTNKFISEMLMVVVLVFTITAIIFYVELPR